jgi:outer membrane protein TolC
VSSIPALSSEFRHLAHGTDGLPLWWVGLDRRAATRTRIARRDARESRLGWIPSVSGSTGFAHASGRVQGSFGDFKDVAFNTIAPFTLIDVERRRQLASIDLAAALDLDPLETLVSADDIEASAAVMPLPPDPTALLRQALGARPEVTAAREQPRLGRARQARTSADATLRISQVRFRNGTSLALEVLQAQQAPESVRLAEVAALTDLAQAQVRLRAELGPVTRADLSRP